MFSLIVQDEQTPEQLLMQGLCALNQLYIQPPSPPIELHYKLYRPFYVKICSIHKNIYTHTYIHTHTPTEVCSNAFIPIAHLVSIQSLSTPVVVVRAGRPAHTCARRMFAVIRACPPAPRRGVTLSGP